MKDSAMVKHSPVLNSWYIAGVVGALYSSLWFVVLNLLNPKGNEWKLSHLAISVGTSALSLGCLYLSYRITSYLYGRMAFWRHYMLMLLISLPLFCALYLFYWVMLIRRMVYGLKTDLSAYPGQLFTLITSLHLVIAIITISSLYNQQVHKVEMQLAKVQSLAAETQLQNLQQQVDPHFLFNSLNILAALIRIDTERSVQFTQKLSEVYRFFLKTKKEVLVSLEEELSFLHDYFYLVRCRFGDAFILEVDNNTHDPARCYIMPGTLQLLIENVIKHNVAEEARPITISITLKGDRLTVTNLVAPKENTTTSGHGLQNLNARYQLLNGQALSWQEQEGVFLVQVPLIKNPV